jgi:aryl-alcohol dehydrogenase-like predicted oxidoreductase
LAEHGIRLGQALGGKRDRVILATKCGRYFPNPAEPMQQIEAIVQPMTNLTWYSAEKESA